jgi:hypothetical protein
VVKGLNCLYDKPCYNGISSILILAMKINGKKFKNRDREMKWESI